MGPLLIRSGPFYDGPAGWGWFRSCQKKKGVGLEAASKTFIELNNAKFLGILCKTHAVGPSCPQVGLQTGAGGSAAQMAGVGCSLFYDAQAKEGCLPWFGSFFGFSISVCVLGADLKFSINFFPSFSIFKKKKFNDPLSKKQ